MALATHRLLVREDGKGTFRLNVTAGGGTGATLTLDVGEFIRRFLLHALPDGFMRIRHYGWLSTRHRAS
jgi:hypothetical protein